MPTLARFLDVRFVRSDEAHCGAYVPAEWRAKAAAMRFPADALRERIAGGLLAEMLAARGVTSPRFAVGPFGKPCLADAPALEFSLSHADAWVMCAVSDRPVGCDVERVVFEAGRDRGFYDEWTRREAGLKALGCGFATGASPDVPPHPSARNVAAPNGYAAAVCTL